MNRIRNEIIILIGVSIIIFSTFLFSSCSENDSQNKDVVSNVYENTDDRQSENLGKRNDLYNFELLYSFKNISLNDTKMVKELVSQFQYAKELTIEQIKYSTENERRLMINYQLNLTKGEDYTVDHTKRMADAVILFALLDDLNEVEYNLVQENYSYGGVPITREEAEQVFDEDIEALGKTKEIFLSEMSQKILDLKWNPDVMSLITYDHVMGLDY